MTTNRNENQSAASPDHVDAVLNYLADRSAEPVTYTYQPPPGVAARSGNYAKYSVAIHNARAVLSDLSLDRQGFAVAHQETAVANFYDEKEVLAVYYPEVERLVKEFTGAVKVHVFDHNVRCRPMAKRRENGAQEPVKVAHNDYTLKSGPQRVRDILPDEAEELLQRRFAIIQVWRPIRHPVETYPLAMADAQTLSPQDMIVSERRAPGRIGQTYAIKYNPAHKWYWFPRMRCEEAYVFKVFDSIKDGRARWTAHTAFEDPTTPPHARPRESIEIRTLAFF